MNANTSFSLRDFFEKVSPIAAILIYMFLCGILYLIGYWSTFDVDISQLIQIWDIPKSFVYPFYVGGGVIILLNILVRGDANVEDMAITPADDAKSLKKRKAIFNISLFVLAVLLFVIYKVFALSKLFYNTLGFTFVLLISFNLNFHPFVRHLLPKLPRRFVVIICFSIVPVFSYTIGKNHSLDVVNNVGVKFVSVVSDSASFSIADTSTKKLIGFLGDKVIVSKIDNSAIYILNNCDFKGIVLHNTLQYRNGNPPIANDTMKKTKLPIDTMALIRK